MMQAQIYHLLVGFVVSQHFLISLPRSVVINSYYHKQSHVCEGLALWMISFLGKSHLYTSEARLSQVHSGLGWLFVISPDSFEGLVLHPTKCSNK